MWAKEAILQPAELLFAALGAEAMPRADPPAFQLEMKEEDGADDAGGSG